MTETLFVPITQNDSAKLNYSKKCTSALSGCVFVAKKSSVNSIIELAKKFLVMGEVGWSLMFAKPL